MGKLALAGGQPVAKLETPAWPIVGKEEEERAIAVTRSGNWSYNGPMETAFNEAWAAFSGSKHSLLVSNGTVALQLAYEALDIGRGDEVIVPGLTFQATASAALDVNAIPVLVDVDPDTWCLDPKAAEAAITSRTAAIVPVHLGCNLADMDAILDLASRNGLAVVEDCAHAPGAQWRETSAGTLGDIGTFSFQQSKSITCGEGGAILAQDDRLFGRLDQLRNCGRFSEHVPEEKQRYLQSGNYRLTEWQAAILLCALDRAPELMERRDACGSRLDQLLQAAPGVQPLKRDERITRRNYYTYPLRLIAEEWEGIDRDKFCRALGAETGVSFWPYCDALNDDPLYQPRTKRRYRLDDEHWAKIDPSRVHLPVCARITTQEGICTLHQNFLRDPSDMDAIAEAITKIYDNRDELRCL